MDNNLATTKIKSFTASPYSVGNSHVFTIPSFNIKAGLVTPGKKYSVTIEEMVDPEKEVKQNV